ncbi:UNVERIFIED_CONTAM: hypothetical protein Slati_2955000, partial [Sesamum latifolium]
YQARAVQQEPLTGITCQSAQVQTSEYSYLIHCPSKLESSPASITVHFLQSESKLYQNKNCDQSRTETMYALWNRSKYGQYSPDPKPLSIVPVLKTSDGYNWSKYGQKQVKSPEETVYRSHHNHDPPCKVNCASEKRPLLPLVPVNWSTDTIHPGINDPEPSSPPEELGFSEIPETNQQESSGSHETTEISMEEDSVNSDNGPEQKATLVMWEYQEMATDGAGMSNKIVGPSRSVGPIQATSQPEG